MFGATTILQNFHIFSNYNNPSAPVGRSYMSADTYPCMSSINETHFETNGVCAPPFYNGNNQYIKNTQYSNNNNDHYNNQFNNNNNQYNANTKYYNYNNQYYNNHSASQGFPYNNLMYPLQLRQMPLNHQIVPQEPPCSQFPSLLPPPPHPQQQQQPQQQYLPFGQRQSLPYNNNTYQYNNNPVAHPPQQQFVLPSAQYQFDNSMLYAPVLSRPMYNIPDTASDIKRGYETNTMARFIIAYSFDLLFGYVPNNISDSFEQRLVLVLNATRLGKSSVLLGMAYLTKKKRLSNIILTTQSEVYLHIVISLILGNKYNDDNTFTNRSWSNATGIPLEQLNAAEREWLLNNQFDLHLTAQGVPQQLPPSPIQEDATKPWLTSLTDLTHYNINPYTVINTDSAYGAFQKHTGNSVCQEYCYCTIESLFNSFEIPTIRNSCVTSPISTQFSNAVANNNGSSHDVAGTIGTNSILVTTPVRRHRNGSYSSGGGCNSMLYSYSASPIITPKSPSLNDYYYYDNDLVGRGSSISLNGNSGYNGVGGGGATTKPGSREVALLYLMKPGYNHMPNMGCVPSTEDCYQYSQSLPGSSLGGYYNDNFTTYKHLDHVERFACDPGMQSSDVLSLLRLPY